MHKLTIMMAASAAILCLSSIGWSANAMTGPGPSKGLPGANDTPRQLAACRGWGRFCPPGDDAIRIGIRVPGLCP